MALNPRKPSPVSKVATANISSDNQTLDKSNSTAQNDANLPYYTYGPCQTVKWFQRYLKPSPWLSGLMFRFLDYPPFNDPWRDEDIVSMVNLATIGRAKYFKILPIDNSAIYSVVMAELLGPYMSKDLCLSHADSCTMLLNSVNMLLEDVDGLRRITNGTYQSYEAEIGDEESLFHKEPLVSIYGPVRPEEDRIKRSIRLLKYFSMTANVAFKHPQLDLLVNITSALCRRGSITDRYVDKIEQGIQADLGVLCHLDTEAIRHFHRNFSEHIDDNTIVELLKRAIPGNAIRLYLTISQIVGSGLTCYLTILKAIKTYQDFNWIRIFKIFPEEHRKFLTAISLIRGNLFYGFRRDLGECKSTGYKSLAYVAKELLIRVGGDRGLGLYGGWPRNIAHKQKIDEMILEYRARLSEREDSENTPEELSQYQILLQDILSEDISSVI